MSERLGDGSTVEVLMLVWVRFEGQTPVRVMGQRVHAGFPSPADDYLEDALDVSQIVVGNPTATFLWRVAGESMRDVGIFDGDLLVCDRSVTARPGDVVVAVVDGSAVVKRLRQDPTGAATLAHENEYLTPFAPAAAAAVEVWGVVMWNLHKLREGRG